MRFLTVDNLLIVIGLLFIGIGNGPVAGSWEMAGALVRYGIGIAFIYKGTQRFWR